MEYEYKPTIAHKKSAVRGNRIACNERRPSDNKLPSCDAKLSTEAKDKPESTIVDKQIDGNCAELPLRGGCDCSPSAQDGTDVVNHPAHYTQGGIECIDAIQAAVTGLSGMEAVCVANAIKYVWRSAHKNGNEDINKAMWYLTRLKKVRKDAGKR